MKLPILFAAALFSMTVSANAQDTLRFELPRLSIGTEQPHRNNIRYVDFENYSSTEHEPLTTYVSETELSPSYLEAYTVSSLWKQGWFISASAVASAFVGEPLGCDDLFGRVKPGIQASIGKWIIPSFGVRAQYQGFDMKSGMLTKQEYHTIMGDWMLDLASLWYKGENAPLATAIPFIGCGYMLNRSVCSHSFGLHYGLIGSLRLSSHFNMNLELSAMTAFKNFDGAGDRCRLGDHLLNASLGFSYTIGNKHNRRRVIDAHPYMEQNRRLLEANNMLKNENRILLLEMDDMDRALREYRKILEIKGWLNASSKDSSENGSNGDGSLKRKVIAYPYNNYSGLNSLRNRLSKLKDGKSGYSDDIVNMDEMDVADWLNDQDGSEDLNRTSDSLDPSAKDSIDDALANGRFGEYLTLVKNHKVCLGAPILFFFELNSTVMTEPSQLANLDEIASLARKHNLTIRIIGAADSETGNEQLNKGLSSQRATFIKEELMKREVDERQLRVSYLGGINKYSPSVANRNTRIELYL